MPEFELGKSNRSLGSVNLPGTNLIPKLMNFSSYLPKPKFFLACRLVRRNQSRTKPRTTLISKKSIQSKAQEYTDLESSANCLDLRAGMYYCRLVGCCQNGKISPCPAELLLVSLWLYAGHSLSRHTEQTVQALHCISSMSPASS